MFEKKDQHHRAMAATNLSFCYFLEQEYVQAEKYADLAYTNDRYNAKALVNKGNCLMVKGDLEMAKQFYLEAIGVEADCVEAIYNLGLVRDVLSSRFLARIVINFSIRHALANHLAPLICVFSTSVSWPNDSSCHR